MTYARKFEHTDDSGDTLYASHMTWTNEEDSEPYTQPDDYLIIRTKQGRPVYLPMRVAREFATWLIEHSAGEPGVMTVPPGHGVAMFGGGGNGGIGRCDRWGCKQYGEQITDNHEHTTQLPPM